MSHHSGYPFDPSKEENDSFRDFLKTPKFGPTGRFPDGKITETDEGEIQLGITHTPEGKVLMEFGKPIHWIGFTKEQAINIAGNLLKHANAIAEAKG